MSAANLYICVTFTAANNNFSYHSCDVRAACERVVEHAADAFRRDDGREAVRRGLGRLQGDRRLVGEQSKSSSIGLRERPHTVPTLFVGDQQDAP